MSEEQTINEEDEYEEIDAAEIEKVTNGLGELMNATESDTIYALLQEAYDLISALAEWEEDEDAEGEQAAAA